jgi:WD40 repeat protein
MGRRGWLGAGLGAASVLSLLRGQSSVSAGVPGFQMRAHGATTFGPSVWALTVSPDGAIAATASEEWTIKFWSVPDGKLLFTIPGRSGSLNSVAFSPDGRYLASSSSAALNLWAVSATGPPPAERPRKGSTTLTVNADGLVNAVTIPTVDRAVSAAIARGMVATTNPNATVEAVGFHPNGSLVAIGTSEREVKLWAVPDLRVQATLTGHTDRVRGVAFRPDGSLLASAGMDRTVRLWSLPGGEPVATLTGHTSTIQDLAISGDGTLLASGSEDRTVRLWSLPEGRLLATLQGHLAGAVIRHSQPFPIFISHPFNHLPFPTSRNPLPSILYWR